jgi:hypothetical protein
MICPTNFLPVCVAMQTTYLSATPPASILSASLSAFLHVLIADYKSANLPAGLLARLPVRLDDLLSARIRVCQPWHQLLLAHLSACIILCLQKWVFNYFSASLSVCLSACIHA